MLSFVGVQFITILTIPIFTKLLTPADFGIYEVYNNTVRFLSVLISLNLYTGFYRFYFEKKLDKKYLMQFLLRTAFISFIIGTIFLWLARKELLRMTNLPHDLFIWIPIGIFSSIVLNFFTTYNNAQQKSTRLSIWQFVMQLLKSITAIFCVLYVSKNYLGRISGENIVLLMISIVVIFVYFRNYIGFKETLSDKYEMVKYSAGFIPIGLSSYLISYLDLVLINNLQGNEASGVYSYAYKFAVIYAGFSQAFITANRPDLFNLLKENKEQEVVSQMRSMFKLVTIVACSFIFFAGDAGRILALKKEFGEALYLLPVLVIGYVFSDITEVYNFFLHYTKKVKLFYISFISTAVVNFILNYLLIPKYGYQVAAYTTLASYMVLFFTTYIVCKFYTNLKVPRWTVLLDYVAALVFAVFLSYLLTFFVSNLWLVILIKAIVLLLFVVYLYGDKIKAAKELIK